MLKKSSQMKENGSGGGDKGREEKVVDNSPAARVRVVLRVDARAEGRPRRDRADGANVPW